MSKRALFIAATGQNVGKTTLCLGMLASLLETYPKVGFIKPVGQRHERVEGGAMVDKDVVLFKNRFQLNEAWEDMSPVIIPSGFVRDFIDKKVDTAGLEEKIIRSYEKIAATHPFTLVEGTGHVGVGAVIGLSNARVAKILGLDMVIIATGGLGSAFDELELNIALCQREGVRVRGVILNKVLPEKRQMILDYFPRIAPHVPLLGCVPYEEFLSNPTMRDFEMLFNAELLSGTQHHYRHFKNSRLAAGSLESFVNELNPEELVVTPANREDIIRALLKRQREALSFGGDMRCGMILTGHKGPSKELVEEIREVDIPVIWAERGIWEAMKELNSYIGKIRLKDVPKVDLAISVVKSSVDMSKLLTP